MASENGEYEDFEDPGDDNLIEFPGHFAPGIPQIRSLDAVREMISQMVQFSANSPHGYFDLGAIESMIDGTTEFEYMQRRFRITVDLIDEDSGDVIRPVRERTIDLLQELQEQVTELQETVLQISNAVTPKDHT
ncbi:hypothetical protein SH661x_003841 [Planctomicrobium sp. SH661]|uniref:hypothetical protein n=1 Tax=Planctomicrobium sp. SH661 TaxID=3448124 RepID=UPI003F5C7CAA